MVDVAVVACCRLATLSTASTPDDSTASHIANQHGSDLSSRRSVTVPLSLADSAISLSSVESSTTLSSDDKNQSGDIDSISRRVFHDTPPHGSTLATDSSPAKNKRKKIGLSRLLRGRQKDL